VIEGFSKSISPPPVFVFDPIYIFDQAELLEGTVRIDIYDVNSILVGRIFLFDLGFLKCEIYNTAGTFRTIYENNAILSVDGESNYIKREPIFFLNNSNFFLRFIQIRDPENFQITGSPVSFKFNIYLVENYVRELLEEVYNVKLQVFGRYSDIWVDYLKESYEFRESDHQLDTDITLLHHEMDESDELTTLLISQSLCNVTLL
jgi:hypothetical protein